MLDTKLFGNKMKEMGFNFYSGVPCSFLKYLINFAINDCDYVMATNEGDAVAISAGAYLAGKKSVVLMQNSGLTNATSPLTSLNYSFKIPVLGFVSLRGEPGISDEPQHELMGPITTGMLDLMEIKWEYLADNIGDAAMQLAKADGIIANGETFFFVVKKGTFSEVALKETPKKLAQSIMIDLQEGDDTFPTRLSALEVINKHKEKSVCLATTGKTGRELYEVEDSDSNLYMVGSMGTISSLGLGIALNHKKKVIVIDGDGSIMMRMGSLVTNASYHPENMLHILLDNNVHDSTGGQFTCSHNVNFVAVAASCGYTRSLYAHNLEELEGYIKEWNSKQELTFIHLKTAKGSKKDLGRPKIKPFEVKERLMNFLNI
jgi:phosphonopyruvate decarboxylase